MNLMKHEESAEGHQTLFFFLVRGRGLGGVRAQDYYCEAHSQLCYGCEAHSH